MINHRFNSPADVDEEVSANVDEDTSPIVDDDRTKVSDQGGVRRIKNRLAQRKYRDKLKGQPDKLEVRRRQNSISQHKYYKMQLRPSKVKPRARRGEFPGSDSDEPKSEGSGTEGQETVDC